MIRVTIDLIPFGIGPPKTLKIFEIANDGTGDSTRGNYKARLSLKEGWVEKIVTNYPRNSYPVTKLVYLVLKEFYAK